MQIYPAKIFKETLTSHNNKGSSSWSEIILLKCLLIFSSIWQGNDYAIYILASDLSFMSILTTLPCPTWQGNTYVTLDFQESHVSVGAHANREICVVMPPSTVIILPVIYDALGIHTNATTCAISIASAKRCNGIRSSTNRLNSIGICTKKKKKENINQHVVMSDVTFGSMMMVRTIK